MKCPECEAAGQRSRVYPDEMGFSTSMVVQRFWDEDGVRHVHDPNHRSFGFSCSNGHRWHKSEPNKCPACDYESGRKVLKGTPA